MNYRAHVLGVTRGGNGLHFDCVVQKETSSGVWEDLPDGQRTLFMQATAILRITDRTDIADAEKRQRLAALFRSQALGWGFADVDAASTAIDALVPSWPVDVPL